MTRVLMVFHLVCVCVCVSVRTRSRRLTRPNLLPFLPSLFFFFVSFAYSFSRLRRPPEQPQTPKMAVPRTSTSPPRVYLPTATPLPPGRLFLLLGQNKQYLGRDGPQENQGLPVIRIKATIHLETPSDIAQGKVGKKIGWIEGWNVQLGRVDNEEYSFSYVACPSSQEIEMDMSTASNSDLD
ncbi:hypothetical protein DB88DRAFT_500378 [Papiliotrema laurentii]|uniref:Uncharacterized protein n=1 Tax=Papiliotrema laurentii TaxID=5418 RepID=A0AAD9FJ94_PAPLA|nr:hypothetical protein DB88DRAFT_500378 [Papiliotrema laurentii]